MSELYLVACVKTKIPGPAPARDLYASPWFKAARRYVETLGCPWLVLSAKHWVVHPNDMLESYEFSFAKGEGSKAAHRRKWAKKVLSQLEGHLARVDSITFLAGKRYREFLVEPLRERGFKVSIPMEHIAGTGKQALWLKENCNA